MSDIPANDFASGVVAMARACKAELYIASLQGNPMASLEQWLDSVIEHDTEAMRKIEEQHRTNQ